MSEPASQASAGRPLVQLWLWPVLLGVLTATGLFTALVSEGWGDVWSWVALGVPVAVMAWFSFARRRSAPSPFPPVHSTDPSPAEKTP